MGIETLYADGIEQAYRRGLTSPAPQADPDFRTFGFLASGLSGIPRGAMEVLASVRDLSAESERQFRESPRGRIVAQEYERRTGVKPADQYRMPGGASIRQAAEYNLAPDPQTSHMADQVFHGLTRFGTKAVGAVAAAGPVGGAALLGAEETNTIYRDLIGRGIDSETALKVAAVQGAISAAGVVLPVSAAGLSTAAGKVAGTAALVGVGGPGAYVAQETLARDILQRAGYADEAGKHDPADPLGLALSTILPAAFGAVSLRGALRTPKQIGPIKTEAGVRDAVQLTPAEQAASDAYERSAANLAELRAEIARTKDPAARQVLEAELAKQTEAAAQAGRGAVAESAARSPEVLDAARVKVLRETVARSLPESPDAYPRLMEAIDSVAAGERVADVRPVRDTLPLPVKAPFSDSAPPPPDGYVRLYRADSPTVKFSDVFDVDQLGQFKRPAGMTGERFTDDLKVAQYYRRSYGPDAGISYVDVPVAALEGRGGAAGEYFVDTRPASEAPTAPPATGTVRMYHGGSPESVTGPLWFTSDLRDAKGWAGRSADMRVWYVDLSAADAQRILGGDLPNGIVPLSRAELPPEIANRRQPFNDAATTPQAADPQAAAPARGAGDDAPPGVPEPGRAAADVQAAGVAMAQQERRIAEALASDMPDMKVTLPGTNEAVSLVDALEQIKAQQALDESDAELLRAAVLCDLSP